MRATLTRALAADSVPRSGRILMLALVGFAAVIGLGAAVLSLAMSADAAPTDASVTSRRE